MFGRTNTYAYTINDPINDSIGYPDYETYGINVSHVGSIFTVDLFTNYPGSEQTGGWQTFAGDFGIDINHDSKYEYGLVLGPSGHDGLATGNLYQVDTSVNLHDSINNYDIIKNGWYTSDSYNPAGHHYGEGYYYGSGEIVTIADIIGSALYTSQINWYGPTGNMPWYRANFSFDTTGLAEPQGGYADIYWSTANCANDVVKGRVSTTPEPATMTLLGLGLLGLFKLRKRQG